MGCEAYFPRYLVRLIKGLSASVYNKYGMRLFVVEVGARERVRPDLGKSKEARPLQAPRAHEAR
jgi:hypothetical protein